MSSIYKYFEFERLQFSHEVLKIENLLLKFEKGPLDPSFSTLRLGSWEFKAATGTDAILQCNIIILMQFAYYNILLSLQL
jgi:hypothetical protein